MKRERLKPADLKAAPTWCAYALEHPITLPLFSEVA